MDRRWWFAVFCFAALIVVAAPQVDARRRVAPFQKEIVSQKAAQAKKEALAKKGKGPFKPPSKGGWKGGTDPFTALKDKASQRGKDFGANPFGAFGKRGKAGKPKVPLRDNVDTRRRIAPFQKEAFAKKAAAGSKSKPFAKPPAAAGARKPSAGRAKKPKGSSWSKPGWNKPGFPGAKGINDSQLKDIHERQEKQFKLMDADEDGAVTAAEVAEVRRRLKERKAAGGSMEKFESTLLKKTEKDSWHKTADKDRNGHLTIDEFKYKKKEPTPQEL